jgi:hypothetical protein
MGRQLKKNEEREILRQVTPQIDEGRKKFIEAGWYVHGYVDLEKCAGWVARKLLNPSISWARITGVEFDELRAVMRPIHRFIDITMLILPVRDP